MNSSKRYDKPVIFNEERRDYYINKRKEIHRRNEESLVVREDALFIKYYGMSAFLELFPEAKNFGIEWHQSVIRELRHIDNVKFGDLLSGFSLAISANMSKKSARSFKRLIKNITKQTM